jgi:hypothetical protein
MEDSADTINLRLTSIEKTLAELKDLVVESKLQQKDINILLEFKQDVEDEFHVCEDRLSKLEARPAKERALRWDSLVDIVFKAFVAAAIAKMGLGR